MLTVHFGARGGANVWLDELPEQDYEAVAVHERVLPAAHAIHGHRRCAAVEWFRPTNGSIYGLLGAHFAPDGDSRLLVRVFARGGRLDEATARAIFKATDAILQAGRPLESPVLAAAA